MFLPHNILHKGGVSVIFLTMDDPRWLRLVTIGLVLAALAVGYFLVSGRFTSNTVQKAQVSDNQIVSQKVLGENSSPVPVISPTPSPQSAYTRIAQRTKVEVQTLPKTGFPAGLFGAFSAGIMVAGWGLRRFPH